MLLLSWLSPLVVPHASDDALCAPVATSDDGPARWAAANSNDPQPHHCIICHSIRSFRATLADCGPAAVTLTADLGVDALADASHRLPAFDRLPARAPPS